MKIMDFFPVDFPLNQSIDTWFSYCFPMVFHESPFSLRIAKARHLESCGARASFSLHSREILSEANMGIFGYNWIFGDIWIS